MYPVMETFNLVPHMSKTHFCANTHLQASACTFKTTLML